MDTAKKSRRKSPIPSGLILLPALLLAGCLGNGEDTDPELVIPDISTPLWLWRGGSAADDAALSITSLADGSLVITGASGGDYQGNPNHGTPGFLALDDDALQSRISAGGSTWDRLHGSAADDHARVISTDGNGNLFLGLTSTGYFNGHDTLGGEDSFVVKTDGNGDISWSVAIASTGNDSIADMVDDGSGGLYAAGYTRGNLPGNTLRGNQGYADWFIAHISATGNVSWIMTGGGEATDLPQSLARDSNGKLLLTGYTWGDLDGSGNRGNADIFVSQIDPLSRTVTWTRMSGSIQSDFAWDVITDGSNRVYVAGSVNGRAVVQTYNSSGTLQWSREIPASSAGSSGRALALYGSGLLLAGDTTAPAVDGFNTAGSSDIFLCTLDQSGNLLDTELYGGSGADFAHDLQVTGSQVFVAGSASGTIYDEPGQGFSDALVMRVR